MSTYAKLKELGIELPTMTAPLAAYVPFVKTGNLVFISGQLAKKGDQIWAGQLGKNIEIAQAKEAAKSCAVSLLSVLHTATDGDLNRVKRIVKIMALVNSSPDFTDHHLVSNGASELLREVFGENGIHARSSFGVAQLPLGACVEVELIAELA